MDGINGRKPRVQTPVSSPTEKATGPEKAAEAPEAQKSAGWAPKARTARPAYMSELEGSVLVDSSGTPVLDGSEPVRISLVWLGS